VIKIIKLYTRDSSYIDIALDFGDPLNNKSSQRLAASILTGLFDRIP